MAENEEREKFRAALLAAQEEHKKELADLMKEIKELRAELKAERESKGVKAADEFYD